MLGLKKRPRNALVYCLTFLEEQWPKASKIAERNDQKVVKEISYNELWLLYSPGTIIYTKEYEEWQAYNVHQIGGFHGFGGGIFSLIYKLSATIHASTALDQPRDIIHIGQCLVL